MNNSTVFKDLLGVVDEEDFIEAGHHFTLLDAAHLLDDMDIIRFFEEMQTLCNNPSQCHVITQLLGVMNKYEEDMYKMKPLNSLLEKKDV